MKYILMCGGYLATWRIRPKHTIQVMGEPIISRTRRLLEAYGADDIAISTKDQRLYGYAPILTHDNNFVYGQGGNHWLEGFYPMKEPVCYIFGDVYFSENAIREIVRTETDSIEFFASAPPFAHNYIKDWAEPFAFKVQDPELFFKKVEECHKYDLEGKFHREAISWELWQVIKGTKLDVIDYTNYHVINDYTCDIDNEEEAREFERRVFGV